MLSKIYKNVQDEKSNQVKDSNTVPMDLNEFIDEHKNLIKVLREGSREELLAEAEKQEEELEICMTKHGMSEDDMGESETD